MKNIAKILLVLAGLFLCQCVHYVYHDYETLLTVQNNSNDDICVYLTSNYPDTIIPDVEYTWYRDIDHHRIFVNARRSGECESEEIDRESYFRKNSIFQVFILLEEHALNKNDITISDIYKNGWVLRRYEFTREQLEQMNWTVCYP